jgi:hypothetical protein
MSMNDWPWPIELEKQIEISSIEGDDSWLGHLTDLQWSLFAYDRTFVFTNLLSSSVL